MNLLAIDVGTQSTRALLFSATGELLGRAQVGHEPAYHAPQPGWAEQDALRYWAAVQHACQTLWDQGHDAASVAALSLTTLRATMVCCDAAGTPLAPAMVWLDQRECTAPPKLSAGWRAAFALAGATPLIAHLQRQAECNWLAQHQPDLWKRTAKFLFLSGLLLHRLTGEFVESSGSVVGYVPFDYKTQSWAGPKDFKWQALALTRDQLPRLVAPGTPAGALTEAAASALGLKAGLPVIAAGADKACEVLGCGALTPDVAQLSFGTSATINTTQPRYWEVQRLLPAYPAATPKSWNTEIQIYRGFWLVSWFKREFAHREVSLAAERGVSVESLFDDLVKAVPPGSMGLTLQPTWSPGVRNPGPEAKGAIIGFGDVHTRAHVYRAILEGLIYGLRAGKEQIEKCVGTPITRLLVSGGGSQSDAAMQITADIFGMSAERPPIYETSGLGAAINAAVGIGLYPTHAAAVKAMCRAGTVFTPRPDAVRTYDALYREVYSPLYGRLKPLYDRIRSITGYPP